MKMTHMPTIHAYQRYRNIDMYTYMVTSIHLEIPPTSKIDDWIKNRINTIYNQSHIPYRDNKDNCHIIKRCPYKVGGSCNPQNHNTCPQIKKCPNTCRKTTTQNNTEINTEITLTQHISLPLFDIIKRGHCSSESCPPKSGSVCEVDGGGGTEEGVLAGNGGPVEGSG